jgi:hypothetical protein
VALVEAVAVADAEEAQALMAMVVAGVLLLRLSPQA